MTRLGRLLCAVVTYNEAFAQTRIARSLMQLPERWRQRIYIFCVANSGSRRCNEADASSAERSEIAGMPLLEVATGCNGGLALGYNLALREFGMSDCDYVCFLNSDAMLSEELLGNFERAQRSAGAQPPLALAPTLVSGPKIVSPFVKPGLDYPFWIISFLFCHRSLLRADFRFPAEYWLDGIDFWLSHYLLQRAIAVTLIPQTVEHHLSVADGFSTIPKWRYRNVIATELYFYRTHEAPAWARIRVVLRALMRCLIKRRPDLIPQIGRAVAEAARKHRLVTQSCDASGSR